MQVKMQSAKCKGQNEVRASSPPVEVRPRGTDLAERLLEFAVACLKLCSRMPRGPVGRSVASQLMRCATSPGANYEEARGAESSADFLHKMQVVLKEIRESRYWLSLGFQADLVSQGEAEPLIREADELVRIFSKSVITAKRSARASPTF